MAKVCSSIRTGFRAPTKWARLEPAQVLCQLGPHQSGHDRHTYYKDYWFVRSFNRNAQRRVNSYRKESLTLQPHDNAVGEGLQLKGMHRRRKGAIEKDDNHATANNTFVKRKVLPPLSLILPGREGQDRQGGGKGREWHLRDTERNYKYHRNTTE